MTTRRWQALLLAAITLLALSVPASAQNRCSGKRVMAGEQFAVNHCAAAIFPDEHSVTLWFNDSPITPDEREAFQVSAYARSTKDGKERTMLLVAFCPGGGQATASASSITFIDLGLNHAASAMAGAQWVVEVSKDFKVERMTGDVKPGARLTGTITGRRSSDGRPYAWDLTFDVTLPPIHAASGVTCRPEGR